MSKAKKMGRPKLPKGEARGVYPLRLSANELKVYGDAAKVADQPLAEWIRSTLTKAASRLVHYPESGANRARTGNPGV